MSLPLTAAEVVRKHVTLELESIDRMYVNLETAIDNHCRRIDA